MASAQPTKGPISAINVTPLVDVVLVLLIVLMVTARAVVAQSLPLDLPEASTGEPTNALITISLDREGTLYLDGEPSSRRAIAATIAQSKNAPGETSKLQVVLEADGTRPHSDVVSIIDFVRNEGVVHFALHVQPGADDDQ